MSNIFQVKRGAQVPSLGGLAPYELGFVVNNIQDATGENGVAKNIEPSAGYLYIGDLDRVEVEGEAKRLVYMPTKIKAGYADEASSATYATEAGYAESADQAGYAEEAGMAGFLTDINEGGLLNMGNSEEPVYFSYGIPVKCGPVALAAFAQEAEIANNALSLSNLSSSIKVEGNTTHSYIQIQTNGGPYPLPNQETAWNYSLNHGVLTAPMLAVKTGNWGTGMKSPGDTWTGDYTPEPGQLYFQTTSTNKGWQQATVYVYMP